MVKFMESQTERDRLGMVAVMSRQFSRYATIGVVSNALLYLAYLGLTGLGVGHKVSMTLVFVAGVVQTYFLNRDWSFSYKSKERSTFFKYCTVYIGAYLLSLFLMWLLVDYFGFLHQLVQIFLIILCAIVIFLSLKFWVFKSPAR